MPANTSPDNIVYPLSTDAIAPLNTVFEDLADSVQAALTAERTSTDTRLDAIEATQQMYQYRWANAAARTAESGMRVGDIGFQVDTEVYYRYTGSSWRVWQQAQTTYTPTFGNTTLGNGTVAGYYSVAAGRVSLKAVFTLGTTSAVTGDISVTLPYTRDTTVHPNGDSIPGNLHFFDTSASARLVGTFVAITNNVACRIVSGTTLAITSTTSTTPFTWATGDQVIANFEYYTSQ